MILDEIILNKRQEIDALKERFAGKDPLKLVEELPQARAFLKKGKFSLIAEIKKASPSAGLIKQDYNPTTLGKVYEEGGASAISVLTDGKYFQGKLGHIKAAKDSTTVPILRKDFILDETQIYESRIAGADALLLIVRVLKNAELVKLIELTESLGMQTLVETHSAEEARRALRAGAKIIGINNRDLDTLEIDLQNTVRIMSEIPELKKRIIISESGIKTKEDVLVLQQVGVDGVLIGETLLKSDNIPAKIRELIG